MRFRDLKVGDTFDFVSPDRMVNSFYARCVKLSARTYTQVEGENKPTPMRVGTINVNVYHIGRKAKDATGQTIYFYE